jgi:hypothetical protein
MIISLIYIFQTVRLLRVDGGKSEGSLRKLFRHLILVNIVVLIFDITLLAVQFSGHYEIQTTYKTAVYSIKLKIEFSVLNRLVGLLHHKDLFSNGQSRTNDTLTLKTWKDTQKSSNPSSHGGFTKIDESISLADSVKGASVVASSARVDMFRSDNDTRDKP